jgi:hypothetical protein
MGTTFKEVKVSTADCESRLVEPRVDLAETGTIVPLDKMVLYSCCFEDISETKRIFLGSPIEAEDNGGKVGDIS